VGALALSSRASGCGRRQPAAARRAMSSSARRSGASSSSSSSSSSSADVVQLKLLLIGDSAVGKTSLLLRYVDDKFSPSFVATIGIDFKVKKLSIDGADVRLQLWDTAGQERFRTITTSYFRGAHGILVVFDMSMRSSFASVANWVAQLRDTEASGGGVALVLVGTKADLAEKLQVTEAEGAALAEQYGMRFFATSAKYNSGIKEAFDVLAREALAKAAPRREAAAAPAAGIDLGRADGRAALAEAGGAGGCAATKC
jgi:Ras-related protein Rab-8A